VRSHLCLSQVALFGLILVCTLIIPSVTEHNGGVSNFGDHASTIVPYIASFALCMVFLVMATTTLRTIPGCPPVYALHLVVIAALDLCVLVSTFPRKINATFADIHDYLGVSLYVYELGLSVWFVVRQTTRATVSTVAIECVGSAIALLSLLGAMHLLFYGQIIGAVGFGLALITAFPKIVAAALTHTSGTGATDDRSLHRTRPRRARLTST
jgi:hypothetical protein